MKIKRITIDALFIALYIILGYLTIDLKLMKVTFQNLPLFIVCILYGPIDGVIVGFMGMFLTQILRYSLMPTTFLWCVAPILGGLYLGLCSKKIDINSFKSLILNIGIASLIITLTNTIMSIIDSKIFGYYNISYILGFLVVRVCMAIILSIVYSVVIPHIIKKLSSIA